MVETVNNMIEVITMKKNTVTYRDEMMGLRLRIENLETKLALTNEPLLVDALSYELLGLRSRLNFLIARAKQEQVLT